MVKNIVKPRRPSNPAISAIQSKLAIKVCKKLVLVKRRIGKAANTE